MASLLDCSICESPSWRPQGVASSSDFISKIKCLLQDENLAAPAEEVRNRMERLFIYHVNMSSGFHKLKEVESLLDGSKIDGKDPSRLLDFQKAFKYTLEWVNFAPISATEVKKLHLITMKHSACSDIPIGEYRTRNVIVGGSDATDSALVSSEMEMLLAALKMRLQEICKYTIINAVQPLISLAAAFFVQFEQIHPFADGNGRVGRLLLTHLLRPITRSCPFNFMVDRGSFVLREELLYSNRLYRFFLQDGGRPREVAAAICEGIYVGLEATKLGCT